MSAREYYPYVVGDHPDGLRMAKALQPVGCCTFCEEPLIRKKTGRPNLFTCGQRDCVRAYQRAVKRDAIQERRMGMGQPRAAPSESAAVDPEEAA